MAPVNVLFFPARYPTPSDLSLATIHREHVRAIALRHEVLVLDAPREEAACRRLVQIDRTVEDGVRVVRVGFRRSPVPKTSLLLHTLAVLQAGRAIVRAGFRPDVIHARYYFIALAAGLLGRLLRVPVVMAEGSECYAVGLPPRIRLESRLAMRLADVLVPASESLRTLMEQHGIRGDFRVIPNPVDTAVFSPTPGRRRPREIARILTVARQVPVKGYPTLLEALARVARAREGIALDIVGDGPERQAHEALARRLGLAERVRFHGHRPREAVARLMREADLFVLASHSENCPSVLLEALACGLPVVASDLESVHEVVPKEMGGFFPAGDAQALAETLDWALDRREVWDPVELAAHARAHFGLEAMSERLDAVYREIVARHADRRRSREESR